MSITVTFLGTSSGGGPTQSRNCSSLVCDFLNDGPLWMVDCAEGTLRQFQSQPDGSYLSHHTVPKVRKIFISHMHADHITGLITFLRTALYPPSINGQQEDILERPPRIEIYGPAGIRTFVRQNLKMTLSKMAENYVVHELLSIGDNITPCDSINPQDPKSGLGPSESNILHFNEVPGRNFLAGDHGLWHGVLTIKNAKGTAVTVDAGPIEHRDPCLGYVFTEECEDGRKFVILGDTCDPSGIVPLCSDPNPSLLIHEATECHFSREADPTNKLWKRSKEKVVQTALARGHSIPEMAGRFAKLIKAERLVLNHIGSRFPAPRYPKDTRHAIISEIERQATEAWGSSSQAIVAYDYMRVVIPEGGASEKSKRPGEEFNNTEPQGRKQPRLWRGGHRGYRRGRYREGRSGQHERSNGENQVAGGSRLS